MGKKNDGSLYNKNDVKAFAKLAEKIKLSLKFILAYEGIVKNKYETAINEKDETIRENEKAMNDKDGVIKELTLRLEKI